MKYFEILLFSCFVSFNLQCNAHINSHSSIKNYIDSIYNLERNYAIHIDSLNDVILNKNWNEIDKVFGLYYWVSKYINYDYNSEYSEYRTSYKANAIETFNNKRGKCLEFSCLFKYLCEKEDIKNEIISGYARRDYFQLLSGPIFEDEFSLHSWNAVYVDSDWKLVDPTNSGDDDLIEYYFDVNPKYLQLTHFPKNEYWQLTDEPIDSVTFSNLPYFSPLFFFYGFKNPNPLTRLIMVNETGSFRIKITHSINVEFIPAVLNLKTKEWKLPEYSQENHCNETVIPVQLNEKGNYLLRIDAIIEEGRGNSYREKGILAYYVKY